MSFLLFVSELLFSTSESSFLVFFNFFFYILTRLRHLPSRCFIWSLVQFLSRSVIDINSGAFLCFKVIHTKRFFFSFWWNHIRNDFFEPFDFLQAILLSFIYRNKIRSWCEKNSTIQLIFNAIVFFFCLFVYFHLIFLFKCFHHFKEIWNEKRINKLAWIKVSIFPLMLEWVKSFAIFL